MHTQILPQMKSIRSQNIFYFKRNRRKKYTDNSKHYCGSNGLGCVLKPKTILEKLRAEVEKIVKRYDMISDQPVVKIVGPAVNFCLKYPMSSAKKAVNQNMFTTSQISKDGKSIMISVDLTLAIEIEKIDEEQWPLQDMCKACHGLQPTDEIKALSTRWDLAVESCHLVAKGGYWNVSFANVESEIMRRLEDDQKASLRTIKV